MHTTLEQTGLGQLGGQPQTERNLHDMKDQLPKFTKGEVARKVAKENGIPLIELKSQSPYEAYKGEIYDAICELLEVDHSDAEGIVDVQEEIVAESYSRDLDPKEAAELIDEQSRS